MVRMICYLAAADLLACATRHQPPNVVIILADDQGWGDLSLHGNPYLRTSRLDSLAKEGAQFEHFYVSPLCAPTRASLLTGRYHLRTGVISVSRGLETMDSDETTLAELFKGQGYATGCFGKWHNGAHQPHHPNDQGFDTFAGFCAGHWPNYFDARIEYNRKPLTTKGYLPDVLTDLALGFLRKHKDQPFFCYLAFPTPHSPHQVPDRWYMPYQQAGLSSELAAIYGMVENIDFNTGRVLDLLQELGLSERTLVVFLSDNGPNGVRYNGPWKGVKGSVEEGGIRTPCFIRWPGRIRKGLTLAAPAAHIDLLPTLADLCGIPLSPDLRLDGVSLRPLLEEKTHSPGPRHLFTHVNFMDLPVQPYPGAVRYDRYRLSLLKDQSALYDLAIDPGQKHDLSDSLPGVARALRLAYEAWFAGVTAELRTQRPILLEGEQVWLPAFEGSLHGGLRYMEGHGWAHDWATHWRSLNDTIKWLVTVEQAADYAVVLKYGCEPGQTGAELRVQAGPAMLKATVDMPFPLKMMPSPDPVPRKEAYQASAWGELAFGSLHLPAGTYDLCLFAASLGGKGGPDINGLELRRLP